MPTTYETILINIQDACLKALKSDSSIEAAAVDILSAAFPSDGFALLEGKRIGCRSFLEQHRITVDDGIRGMILRLVEMAAESCGRLMEYVLPGAQSRQPSLPRFLDICAWMADASLELLPGATGTLPARILECSTFVNLIEDVVEMGTISDAPLAFSYMESKLQLIKREDVFNRVKNIVLRLCNTLLKRLSKTQDTLLCGRILFLLARFFPLSERSGVNVSGMVNVGLVLPVDDVEPGAVDSIGEPIDPHLYRMLWGLQPILQNPGPTLASATAWERTLNDIGTVISLMSAHPITVSSLTAHRNREKMDHGADAGVSYLSSSSLFGLQLRDATFRRTFLVQVLILLHTAAVHPPVPLPLTANPPSRDPKLVALADELSAKVYEALAATPEEGAAFTASVRAVLARETAMVAWKKESCPPFDKPPAGEVLTATAAVPSSGPQGPAKRRRVGGAATPRQTPRMLLASMLEVPADSLAGLKMSERSQVPSSFREFLQAVIDDMDPENAIEETYKRQYEPVYSWRAMRLLSRYYTELYSNNHHNKLENIVKFLYPNLFPGPPEPAPAASVQQGNGTPPAESMAGAAADDVASIDGSAVEAVADVRTAEVKTEMEE